MKVRIGYGLGTQHDLETSDFGDLVDGLEGLGFDSLWLSERVGAAGPDPVVGLAYAAGRTKRIKFGTSVMVLPGRSPALVAKQLASLDRLSNGRLLPAFGLGVPDPNEQQAFGVAREDRAAWFDEALPLIRRLWAEDRVDHDGPRFTYKGVSVRPKPTQARPDVWLGGIAPSELRRVGRLGDGWLPSFCTPEEAAAGRLVIEAAAAAAGRDMDPDHYGALVIYTRDGLPDRLAQAVSARRPGLDPSELVPDGLDALNACLTKWVEHGFSKFVLVPAVPPTNWLAELEDIAQGVLPLQDVLSGSEPRPRS